MAKQATLYDPKGKAKPVVVDVGGKDASYYQSLGWVLDRPKDFSPSVEMPTASLSPSSALNKDTGQTLQAYNPKGESVYVKPGEYNPGISLNLNDIKAADDAINENQAKDQKEDAEKNAEEPAVRGQTAMAETEAIKKEYDDMFYGKGERPKAQNLEEQYAKERERMGVSDLEQQLADYKKQERDIQAMVRKRKAWEESQPVALGVIAGRQREIVRQEQENIDAIMRQQAYVTDQLNMKYSVINNMMKLRQTDYENAKGEYDSQFNQNMQVMNYVKGVRDSEKSAAEKERDDARANLQIIQNNITSGNIKYEDLPADTKTNLSKLELKAGLPVGFTANLKGKNPDAEIVSTTTRQTAAGDKYADVIMRDRAGKVSVQSVYLGKERLPSTGSGSSSSKENDAEKWKNLYAESLRSKAGKDGHVSNEDWAKARSKWAADSPFTTEDFDDWFSGFVNPQYVKGYRGFETYTPVEYEKGKYGMKDVKEGSLTAGERAAQNRGITY